jgi:hypothetical protein
MLRAAGSLTSAALLYSPLPALWSSVAWGQQAPTQLNSPAQPQLGPRKLPKATAAAQPSLVESPAPNPTPIAVTAANPASALGSALVSCDKGSEAFEPVSLPGAKGEIKLDRCYRGRDHLVCSFNALLSEAKSLLENYRKIVDANYPELGSVDDVCRKRPDGLATDLQDATDFAVRFRALKAEYGAHANCANRIEQSFRDVTLPDMAQAPAILKSMIDSIEGDIKGVSVAQAQLLEFAGRINSSQKAILTIQKIHRTMCVRNQPAKVDAENRENAVMPGPSIIPVEIEAPQPGASDAKFAPDPVFAALQPTPAPKANTTPATTATSRAAPPRDVHDATLGDGPISRGWKYLRQKTQDYLMWLQYLMGVKGTS